MIRQLRGLTGRNAEADGTISPAPAPDARKLTSFKFPDKYANIEEHLAKAEKSTGPFDYVSIATRSKVPYRKLLEKIGTHKQSYRCEEVNYDDIPNLALRERSSSFSIRDCLPKSLFKSDEFHYVNIVEVLLFFVPTQSFNSSFSAVTITLVDDRQVEDTDVRSCSFPSNVGFHGFFGLDHSVHKSDIENIKLRVELANSPLRQGIVWGSLKIIVKAKFTDIAICIPVQRTTGQLRMPDTAFMKFKRNPNHLDLTLDNEDMNALRGFAKKGRIIDHTVPTNKQSKIMMTGSEAGSDDSGDQVMSDSPNHQMQIWLEKSRDTAVPEIPIGEDDDIVEEEPEIVEEIRLKEERPSVKKLKGVLSNPDPSTSAEAAANTVANRTEAVKSVSFNEDNLI